MSVVTVLLVEHKQIPGLRVCKIFFFFFFFFFSKSQNSANAIEIYAIFILYVVLVKRIPVKEE